MLAKTHVLIDFGTIAYLFTEAYPGKNYTVRSRISQR